MEPRPYRTLGTGFHFALFTAHFVNICGLAACPSAISQGGEYVSPPTAIRYASTDQRQSARQRRFDTPACPGTRKQVPVTLVLSIHTECIATSNTKLGYMTDHNNMLRLYIIMAALCNRGAIIFLPCSFFLLLLLFFLA